MLYRKIGSYIENHFRTGSDKILVLEGARQIGKSYIIREVGKRLFRNFVEINFASNPQLPMVRRFCHQKKESA